MDSDGSDDVNRKFLSASSSPLSSQQTIDFSDLPPLPLVHSAGVGGALDTEIGDLPAEILDRGSDGSEVETAGPSAGRVNVSENSDVDVEKVEDEDGETFPGDRQNHAEGHRDVSPSDKNLLRTILSDLNQISAAELDLSQNPRSSLSSEARTTSPQEDCPPDETKQCWTSSPQSLGYEFQTSRDSAPSLPPLDVPPLLRRASPVRSYNRNTPPPLKHKDAGSPQRTATCPRDVLPHCSSDVDPGGVAYRQTIPSFETLQAHLRKVSSPHCTPPPPPETPHSSDLSSVSRGGGVKTTSPHCWVSPVDPHPPRSSGPDSNEAPSETRRGTSVSPDSPEPPVDLLSLIPSSRGQLDRRTADGRLNHVAFPLSPVQHSDTFHPSKSSFRHPSDAAPLPPAHTNHLTRDRQALESSTNPEPRP